MIKQKVNGAWIKVSGANIGGSSDFDELTNRPQYNSVTMDHTTNIPEVKTTVWDGKLDATKSTFQTTAPTADITDGGVHIVYLSAEPSTYYNGYIYMIAE